MAWLHEQKRVRRKTGKKAPYWSIKWRDEKGLTHTRAIGYCTKSEAKRALKVIEGKLAAGEPVTPKSSAAGSSIPRTAKKSEVPTLRSYLDDVYLTVVARDKAPKTVGSAHTAANALKDIMGDLRLDQISFAVIDAYLNERRKLGRKSRTLKIELWCLGGALQHAEDCGVIESVPKFPKVRLNDARPHRYLTPKESVALLDALKPLKKQPHRVTRGKPPITRDRLTYLAVLMALNTGARKNEILTRRWEDVHWNQGQYGTLIIGPQEQIDYKVKTRRSRVVPLTPELAAEMTAVHGELGSPGKGWIFPSPGKGVDQPRRDFGQALKRACKRAGLPPIHPHGLRHTWASRLAMAGVDRKALMELGGWKEGRMLDEIYAHVTSEHKVEIMARMGLTSSSGGKATLRGAE